MFLASVQETPYDHLIKAPADFRWAVISDDLVIGYAGVHSYSLAGQKYYVWFFPTSKFNLKYARKIFNFTSSLENYTLYAWVDRTQETHVRFAKFLGFEMLDDPYQEYDLWRLG